MRTISPAMLAHLASDTRTVCNMWQITRKDAQVFGFTDHDTPIKYNGVVYGTLGGFSTHALEFEDTGAPTNTEVIALFDSGPVNESDILAGLWDNALVNVFMINYMDLTMGQVSLASGFTGQFQVMNGKYVAEFRGLAQLIQQDAGEVYSPTCRASLGDSRCTVPLGPLTYNGTVSAVLSRMVVDDPGLTAFTAITSEFIDATGHYIPTTGPYTITPAPPNGAAWASNVSVMDGNGRTYTAVGSAPGEGQYTAIAGVYTFNSADAGVAVFINFNYTISYFAYGTIKFTSGQNAGYSTDIKSNSTGSITFALPLPHPVAVGDTYTAIAGCDRNFSTCKNRFNNVIHFRGEPYIPGTDNMVRLQSH